MLSAFCDTAMDFVTRKRVPSPASNKRSTSASFLERRLGSLSISRRGGEPLEQTKGPLGLNLLWEPSEPRIDFVFVSFKIGISISIPLNLAFMVSEEDHARHGASRMIQLITGPRSGFHVSQVSETFAFTAMGTMRTLEKEKEVWSTYTISDKLC